VQVIVTGGPISSLVLYSFGYEINCRELQEIRRALRNHEGAIQGNKCAIVAATGRIQEYDNFVIFQISLVMGTLVQFKRQISVLEVNCTMLCTVDINLSKVYQLGAIHQFKLWGSKSMELLTNFRRVQKLSKWTQTWPLRLRMRQSTAMLFVRLVCFLKQLVF
jgi:hypothetical protein